MIKRLLAMGLIVWLCMPLLGYAQVKDEPKETLTYLYKDALGSTIAKADETGKIIWQKDYLPYGEQTGDSWGFQPVSNTLQYTNAAKGPNGLFYLKARYYNPDIGRFYAIDPVWYREDNPQSFGRYTYANNSPFVYKDPDGKLEIIANYSGNDRFNMVFKSPALSHPTRENKIENTIIGTLQNKTIDQTPAKKLKDASEFYSKVQKFHSAKILPDKKAFTSISYRTRRKKDKQIIEAIIGKKLGLQVPGHHSNNIVMGIEKLKIGLQRAYELDNKYMTESFGTLEELMSEIEQSREHSLPGQNEKIGKERNRD